MTDSDNELLMREAAFGMNIEAFLEGPIGTYMVARAEADIQEAQAGLSTVDPHNWQEVQRLQNTIRVAEAVQVWLADAVAQGDMARNILEDRST